ncbi:ferric reductase NAD binding domain-containing protein [Amylostereum chailletii]|nr:ferric reductase NAD binding domain-containing protein [Amylostereum chailletii]
MASATPTVPPLLVPSLSQKALKSIDKVLRIDRAADYPKQVWYFLACFIFLVGLVNHLSLLSFHRRRRTSTKPDAESHHAAPARAISYRRLPLAVVNAWRIVAFRSHIRIGSSYSLNLAEIFMTATYITILFVWTLHNSDSLVGVHYDPQYFANRAATIASLQLPLIAALGMENSIIGWITGVSYEKLNYLHRMCARTVMVLIWLHAGGRIKIGLVADVGVANYYIRCGILAATALTLLCIVSIRPVRETTYELFLVTHFCLVLVLLLAAYFHTREYDFSVHVWPAFIFWGLDRVLRLARFVAFNHSYFGLKSGLGTFNATAELVSPDFVRLRLRRPRHFRWTPGQNAWLTMPGVSALPWEAHPFTIASVYDDEADLAHADKTADRRTVEQGKELVFIIKAQQGFTRRLEDVAQKSGTVKVFVDGPYGAPPRLAGYDTALFIAGGSGVSFTHPLFVDLVRRARHDPSTCRRAVFLWAVRHAEDIDLIHSSLSKALHTVPSSLEVEVHIYITGGDSSGSSETSLVHSELDPSEKQSSPLSKLARIPRTRIKKGRPDVREAIAEAAALAQGSMAVALCGPSSMVVDGQRALRSSLAGPANVLRGGPSITLFVESFGYN